MKRVSISFFLRFVFIVTLLSGIGWTQQSKQMVIKEIQTDIQNPTGIITIDEPFDKSSPVRQIVRTEQELLFCDENFRIINRRSLKKNTRITCSKNYKYLLLDDQKINDKKGFEKTKELTLIDNNGQEIWSKTGIIEGEDDKIYYKPSDYNGNVFQVDHDYSTITTISNDGKNINKFELFESIEYRPGRRLYMDISKSGEYCVVLTEKFNSHARTASGAKIERIIANNKILREDTMKVIEKEGGEPTLFLFNNDGVLLNKMRVQGEQPSNVFINDNGTLIFYVIQNLDTHDDNCIITLINNNFEELFSKSISGHLITVLFTNNLLIITYLDTIDDKFKLAALDINTGFISWINELRYVPVSLFEIDNQSFSLITCSEVYGELPSESYWYNVFDLTGKSIAQLEIGPVENEYIYTLKPNMYFNNRYFIYNNKIKMINDYRRY